MSRTEAEVAVKVWGDYACFSRPEFKVERVSYPVMTPSAARGALEAIFWKPEIRFQIREIWVLKLGGQMTLLRNELAHTQGIRPIRIEDAGQRQQRSSLILKDVAYLIKAAMLLRAHAKDPIMKYLDCFIRRVERGQCHHTPYLGTREFAAWFEKPDGTEQTDTEAKDRSLGTMLFDIAFVEDPDRHEMSFLKHGSQGHHTTSGFAQALFFDAALKSGILNVPATKYQELYALEDKHV